jgi:type VI secretion system protein ImpE
MVGEELLKAGRLSEALERVAEEVKAKPGDLAARTFYFELLSLNGDLDRAAKQLDVLADSTGEMGALYFGAIQAERERRAFFHGGPRPRLLAEPPYAASYLEAVECYAASQTGAALERLQSVESYATLHALLNGGEVRELSESHDLLGPFLELVIDNHYAWVPWESIQSLTIPEPRYLRNTVWTPASLSLHSGDQGQVLIFSLYVDSHLREEDIKLGRRTIWEQDPAGFTIAYGQKVIATEARDWPILEIRSVEVEACRLVA